MATIYCGSTKYSAVTAWTLLTAKSVGDIVRQAATPTVGDERCFRCTTAGTTGATEPTWTLTANGTTNDGSVTWTECTGQAAFNGDGGGTAYGAPHARIGNALAFLAAASDGIYVSNNHAETQSTAITWPSTTLGSYSTNPRVICVDDATVPPTTRATTATVSTTGASSINLQCPGLYIYGIQFQAASGGSNGNINIGNGSSGIVTTHYYDNCVFKLNGTNTAAKISIGVGVATAQKANQILFNNPSFLFSNTSQKITLGNVMFDVQGGSVAATGSVPATVMEGIANSSTYGNFHGTDFSAVSASTLFNAAITTAHFIVGVYNSGFTGTLSTGTPSSQATFNVVFSNNVLNLNQYSRTASTSSVAISTSAFVDTNGANTGSQAYSWITAASSINKAFPITCPTIVIWNSTVGSVTATVQVNTNGGATLGDQTVWMEVEYPSGTNTTAIKSSQTSELFVDAGVSLATSSETWTGVTSGLPQKISCTFTTGAAGPLKVRVFITSNTSNTIYIDPKVTLS